MTCDLHPAAQRCSVLRRFVLTRFQNKKTALASSRDSSGILEARPRAAGPAIMAARARSRVLLAAIVLAFTRGLATADDELLVGLDFGSEWIKIAAVQGTSIDIVLNENSQRKSMAAIAFPDAASGGDDELRLFGEAAMARPHLALQFTR